MNVFEMIVVIVFISVIGGVISKSIKASYQQKSRKNEADNSVTERHLAELEKRIIVLEQIVTSEGYDLNQQFKDIEKK